MNTIGSRFVLPALCLVFLSCSLPPAAKSGPDAPYLPTPPATVLEMLRLADLTEKDRLYDLGCGDGRIVVAAALHYGVQATGVEIDAGLIAEARARAGAAGVSGKTSFVKGDLFAVSLAGASVVTLYLLPGVNVMLRPKLLSELKPGSRVVSHMHDMAEWRPDRTVRIGNSIVYLWVIPADVDGTWDVTVDGPSPVPATLFLRQSFQDLSGTFASNRKKVRIADAGLDGGVIRFTATGVPGGRRQKNRFTGRVYGKYIEGTMTAGANTGRPYRWTAQRRE